MTDIVERLRAAATLPYKEASRPLYVEAADEIERLRERLLLAQCWCSASADEIERLRKEAGILASCKECVISLTLPQTRNYAKGAIWYNSGTGKLERVWDGQAWVELT